MIKNISIGLHGDVAVVVSFEAATEEHLICGVAMKLGVNGRDYETYIDDSGAARSHTFVLPVRDQSVTSKSVMYAAVSVEDPEGNIHEFYAVRMFALENGYPVVDNVGVMQRTDGSGLVDIWYDYFSPYEICPASVTLGLSDDNGKTFDVPTVSAAGDLGGNIPTGTSRHIVWSPLVDLPNVGRTDLVAWVHLVDIRGVTADGFAGNAEINVDKPKTYVVLKQEDEKTQWGVFSGENIKDKTMVAEIESSSSWSSSSSPSSQSSSSFSTSSISSQSSMSSTSQSSSSTSSESSPSTSSKNSSSSSESSSSSSSESSSSSSSGSSSSSVSSSSSSSSSSGSSSSASSSDCYCVSPSCTDVKGVGCSHLSSWTFSGMRKSNTYNCILYVVIYTGFPIVVPAYIVVQKWPPGGTATTVAIGEALSYSPQTIQLVEQNSSGLNGTVDWDGVHLTSQVWELVLSC